MTIYAWSPLIASVFLLSIGIFVYYKNVRNSVNILFLNLSIIQALWTTGCLAQSLADVKIIAVFADKVIFTCVALFAPLLIKFTRAICGLNLKSKKLSFLWIIAFVFIFINIFDPLRPYLIKNVAKVYEFRFIAVPNIGLYALLSFLLLGSCYAFFIALRTLIANVGIKRNQIKYLLISYASGALGIVFYFLLVFNLEVLPIDNILEIIYACLLAYAIVRYRLMDINLAITRTGIFVTVYSLVLGIPFWFAYGMQERLRRAIGENWWIVPLVLLTLLAMLVPFIYLYVQRKAEDRLLREQRRYQQTLRRASAGMTRIRNLKKLLNLIVHVVTRTVHLKHSSIYLHVPKEDKFFLQAFRDQRKFKPPYSVEGNSTLIKALRHDKQPIVYEEIKQRAQDFNDVILLNMQKEMESLDAAVVVPSLVEEGLIGFLVLGEKISGRLYSQDDLAVFSVLANQSALAIENARYLESLSEAQKQLAQSERLSAMGKFAASIVHEVKNPLTVIKTFTEFLPQNYQDKAFIDKYSRIVGSEADKMNNLARQLLDFSKPHPLNLENADINQLLDETLNLLSAEFTKHGINVETQYFASLPLIALIDGNQIKQVFLNLFLNAVEAMPVGGILTIQAKDRRPKTEDSEFSSSNLRSSVASKSVFICVKDTGSGIPEDALPHIFEPFYSTKKQGTGLGLAVVYSIIKEHGGDIRVRSEESKGTEFIIELPIAR